MLSKNSLYMGDCLELMKHIPDKSIDMILCDLPYGTTRNKWDSIIPLEPLWREYERVIKDNGAIVLNAQTPFDKVLGVSNLKMLRYEWIWKKSKPTGHLNAKKSPLKAHENVLVFYKNAPTYNPQGIIEIEPFKQKRINGTNYGSLDKETIQTVSNYPISLIEHKSVMRIGQHPTEKPVSLYEYLIRTYTNEGETVLDNCIGSGTTAIACINTGRFFIGMEKDETYFKVANERIQKHIEAVKQ